MFLTSSSSDSSASAGSDFDSDTAVLTGSGALNFSAA